MKQLLKVFTILLLLQSSAGAQTWDELFNQKKTQTRYLMEQIAALKVYTDHLQKTYRIAKDGLNFISKATKGEFDLHDGFFTSLKQVNPEVSKYPQVEQIMLMQQGVLSNYRNSRQVIAEKKTLNKQEVEYVERVFERVLADCSKILDELSAVVSEGKLEMKDAQRITRINELHGLMQDNYRFAQWFADASVGLATGRQNALDELQNNRTLNNIKK